MTRGLTLSTIFISSPASDKTDRWHVTRSSIPSMRQSLAPFLIMMWTSSPLANNRRIIRDPINPVAPVTRYTLLLDISIKMDLRVIEWVHLYLLEHAGKDFQ